jgi:hypothetical protein
MRGNTGIAILGPRDRRATASGGGEDNTDSGPVASNGKERARASAQKQKKKEGNTLMRLALNTSGVLPHVRVKEAAKVSDKCG